MATTETRTLMGELVLIHQAAQESGYTARHISLLLRQGKVAGRKEGRIWLVDLDDLRRYQAEIKSSGSKKSDTTKNDCDIT